MREHLLPAFAPAVAPTIPIVHPHISCRYMLRVGVAMAISRVTLRAVGKQRCSRVIRSIISETGLLERVKTSFGLNMIHSFSVGGRSAKWSNPGLLCMYPGYHLCRRRPCSRSHPYRCTVPGTLHHSRRKCENHWRTYKYEYQTSFTIPFIGVPLPLTWCTADGSKSTCKVRPPAAIPSRTAASVGRSIIPVDKIFSLLYEYT